MVKTYKAVKISRGSSGWGGPLVIQPTEQRNKVVSVTGGGIHPVAAQIAEMTGAEAVDGFRAPPVEGEMAVVVVDCGGTARCGVYPRKRIPTVNLTPVGQAGPLAQFITEDIYVSGVKPANIEMADGSEPATAAGGGISRLQDGARPPPSLSVARAPTNGARNRNPMADRPDPTKLNRTRIFLLIFFGLAVLLSVMTILGTWEEQREGVVDPSTGNDPAVRSAPSPATAASPAPQTAH